MAKYVLITAARNEEDYIEKTIRSVISQTVLPERWIIVSDGSTDRTDEIVLEYARTHRFIILLRTTVDSNRNFGSKAKAIAFGYQQLTGVGYDYIGNLDADVSFTSTYYENVIAKFKQNPKLGVAGGIRFDLHDGKFEEIICARNSVGGPFQFFRRECYEAIGGYLPLKYGGVDAVAEISARMFGWEVASFPELKVYHYRLTGTANGNLLQARYRCGIRDYLIGYHPLFQTFRALNRLKDKPAFIGSIFFLWGYLKAAFLRHKRPVSGEFVKYLRAEQRQRMRAKLGDIRILRLLTMLI